MFISFRLLGSNTVVRVALDKILFYEPSPTNATEVSYLYLSSEVVLKVKATVDEIDKQLSFIVGVKDINGHLVDAMLPINVPAVDAAKLTHPLTLSDITTNAMICLLPMSLIPSVLVPKPPASISSKAIVLTFVFI